MKLFIAIILLIILNGCAFLDNSGKHKPIYLTDPRYHHFRQGSFTDIAPWPDCPEHNTRSMRYLP